jgi:hypothetical protein
MRMAMAIFRSAAALYFSDLSLAVCVRLCCKTGGCSHLSSEPA